MVWSQAFHITLIMDSIVFVLKLSVPIFLIVSGADELRWFNQREKSDSSHLTEMIIVFYFLGGSFVLILTLLRFLTNWNQYRNERENENHAEGADCVSSHFCSNLFWFFITIGHIAIDGALIGLDWTEGEWLTKVVISFLCWECLMFCFMVIVKLLFRKATSVSRKEIGWIPQQKPVKECREL